MTILKVLIYFNVIISFLLNIELETAHLAVNKSAYDCKGNKLSNKIIDGETSYEEVEIIATQCDSNSFVTIDLHGYYIVHYVVVYEGREATAGQLDFFTVKLIRNDMVSSCEFPKRSHGPEGGMKVSCDFGSKKVNKVQVEAKKVVQLYISEIEVISIGLNFPTGRTLIYRGCFSNFDQSSRKIIGKSQPFDHCLHECVRQFLAIKKNECYCANDFNENDEINLSFCKACSGNFRYCGRNNSFAVYIIKIFLPVYIGCYPRSYSLLDAHFTDKFMTVSRCLSHCENYQYALLHGGNNCLCKNKSKDNAQNIMQCEIPCNGDSSTFCGSIDRFSAYTTCLGQNNKLVKCSKLFKCSDQLNQIWDCDGNCKDGFVGEQCLTRADKGSSTEKMTTKMSTITMKSTKRMKTDLSTITTAVIVSTNETNPCDIDNPCIDLPHTFCMLNQGKASCDCVAGYTKDIHANLCKDLDECSFEPCDAMTSTCENLNGSYECVCLAGFYKIEDNDCIANSSEFVFSFLYDSTALMFFAISASVILISGLLCYFLPKKINDFSNISTDTGDL